MYGSPIWAGCISQKDTRRLSSCLNKTLRIHCHDFRKSKHNHEICNESNIRSFKSLALIHDAKTPNRLVTQCSSFNLTQRLTSQAVLIQRFPGHISFMDYRQKRVARNSFINRARLIAAKPSPTIGLIWHLQYLKFAWRKQCHCSFSDRDTFEWTKKTQLFRNNLLELYPFMLYILAVVFSLRWAVCLQWVHSKNRKPGFSHQKCNPGCKDPRHFLCLIMDFSDLPFYFTFTCYIYHIIDVYENLWWDDYLVAELLIKEKCCALVSKILLKLS